MAAESPDRPIGSAKIGDLIVRLAELRRIIHEVDSDVVEDWRWRGTPVWSHDGMYVTINAFKDKGKVTYFHGVQLPDPNNVFSNGFAGHKFRAIDIRRGDTANEDALKEILRAAIAYNAERSVPKGKGSRGAKRGG